MQLALDPASNVPGPTRSATRLRPYLAAGVALAGASLIAVNPVAPPAAGIQEHSVELTSSVAADIGDLTSLPAPIAEWVNVISAASTNLEQIGTEIAADPLPNLSQVMHNQVGFADTLGTNLQSIAGTLDTFLTQDLPPALQALVSGIAAGDISSPVNNLLGTLLLGLLPVAQPLQTILGIPGEMSQNLTNAIDTLPTIGLNLLLTPLGPLDGTTQAMADSAQSIIDAIGANQPVAAFTDLLNTPAIVTGAFLNGYNAPQFFIDYDGLLTPETVPGFPFTGGPLDALLVGAPQTIAAALGASSTSAASLMSDLSAVTDIGSLFGTDLAPNFSGLVFDLLTSI